MSVPVPLAPGQSFDVTTLRSPSIDTMANIAKDLNRKLFNHPDHRFYATLKDIAIMLNKLSRSKNAPNPSKIPWGDALIGIVSMHSCMKAIGRWGTAEQHNTKKAVLAMLSSKDTATGKVQNRPLLNSMTSHLDDHCRAEYVNKSLARRAEFDRTGDTVKLCHDVQRQSRNS